MSTNTVTSVTNNGGPDDFNTDVVTVVGPGNYYANHGERVCVNATAGAVVVYVPAPAGGESVVVKRVDAGTNTITVNGNGVNIDGSATATVATSYGVLRLGSDGTQWWSGL